MYCGPHQRKTHVASVADAGVLVCVRVCPCAKLRVAIDHTCAGISAIACMFLCVRLCDCVSRKLGTAVMLMAPDKLRRGTNEEIEFISADM